MIDFIRRKKLIWSVAITLLFTFAFTFIGLPYQTAFAEEIKNMPNKNVKGIVKPGENVNRPSDLSDEIIAPPDDLPKRGKDKIEMPSMRNANSKTFLEPDGTFSTDVYPESIFYKNNKLQWVPIDSTLVSTDAAPYTAKNKANRFSVMFGNGSKVRYQQEDLTFDFQPSGARQSTGTVSDNKIKFADIYENVDIEYTSFNDLLKEDIILKSSAASNTFTFDVNLKNLRIEKDDKTGLLTLYNRKDKAVGYFMAPFMVDANEKFSDKVTLDYKQVNGKDQLVVTADSGWLKDPERAYPVRIDPPLSPTVLKNTFVSDWYPTNNYSTYTILSSGYDSSAYGKTRSFMEFILPSLPSSSKVTSSSFSLYQLLSNTATNVGIHKITSAWTATGTNWNVQPTFNTAAESNINSTATGYWTFYITNLTKSWYDGSAPNYGIAVKHATETETVKRFNSTRAASNTPYMTIYYSIDPIGHEEQWGYSPEGVNGFNGNLLYQASDLSIPGRGIPVSFTRSYNSRSAKDSVFGYGWSSNAGISVKDSGYGPVTFTDEDGTEHVFQRNADGTFTAPAGIYLTLVKNSSTGIYTITEQDGTKIEFNSSGQLTKITDTQKVPNSTIFAYTSGKLSSITDASGRVTNFYYGTNGKLSKITDPANRDILYGYDTAGNLTTVTDPAGKVTTYSYDTNHNLTGITDPNNNTRTYVYDTVNDRVSQVKENVTVNGVLQETITQLAYTTGTGVRYLTRTDAKNVQSRYAYDDEGKFTEVINDYGDATHQNERTGFTYNTINKVIELKDPNQKTYTSEYSLATGMVTKETNPLLEINEYKYRNNNLIESIDPEKRASNNNFDSSNNNTETMDTSIQISASRYKDNGNVEYEVPPMSSSENMVYDSSIEYDLWSYDKFSQNAGDQTNMSASTTYSRFGNKSLKIGNTTGWATFENTNTIDFDNTKAYTFSAYVRTENLSTDAAYIMINLYGSSYQYLGEVRSQKVGGTTPWTRLQVSIDKNNVPAGTAFMAAAVGRSAATGDSYYDGLQLEAGSARSSYNMVNEFERDVNPQNNVPDWWTFSHTPETGEGLDANFKKAGNSSFKIIGRAGVNKNITHRIYLTGDQNSKLTLSGISNTDNPNPSGGKYAISAKVNYSLNDSQEFTGNFVKDANVGWQPVTLKVAPTKPFTSIDVTYHFENQSGNAWFDSACLLEDDKGTSYSYDTRENYVTSVKDPVGNTTIFEYDTIGNRTKVTDPKNNSTSFAYDLMNRLTQVTDALLGVTKYGYDNNGNRTTVTDAKNNITTYGYNERNQIKSITDALPTPNTITFDYDEVGNQTAINYPGKNSETTGYKVGLTYDNANRLKSILNNTTTEYSFNYDSNGNRIAMVDVKNNRTTQYHFDDANKLYEVIEPNLTNKLNYYFDKVGNITSLVTTIGGTGYTTNFSYDTSDRMTKVSSGTAEKSFVYDEQGNVLSTLTGDKSRFYLNYDNAGRLTGLLLQKVNLGTLGDYKYTYDANGNITAISYKGDSIGNGTISYTYDALNRLTKETLRDGSTKEYWYDAVGNRTKRVTTPASGTASTADYTYDEANQLKSVNTNTGYAYDKNGNMISDGSRDFEYDFNNRLFKVTNKSDNSPIASYEYDADGRRTATITPTATTKYYYDGTSNNVLYETDASGNLLVRYIYGTDYKPEVMIRGVNTYYYHYNGHGDVVALTDQNGTVVAEYNYDAYGLPVSTGREGTVVNPYRYAGYRWDSETGFYYLNARYYWAEVGRFITRDKVMGSESSPASLNLYNYCAGNPCVLIDPSGQTTFRAPYVKPVFWSGSIWANCNRFDDLIAKWTQWYNESFYSLVKNDLMNPNLVKSLIYKESSFRVDVTVYAGTTAGYARGLGQLTDQTLRVLKTLGLNLDPYNPSDNIRGTIRWLFYKRIANKRTNWFDVIWDYKGRSNVGYNQAKDTWNFFLVSTFG